MNLTVLEKQFYHWTLNNPNLLSKIKKGFYSMEEYEVLTTLSLDFFNKFNTPPSRDQIEEIIKVKGIEFSNSKLDAIYEIDMSQYEKDWLEQQTHSWIEWNTFDKSIHELINYVKTVAVTTENVHDVVEKGKRLIADRNNLTFDFDEGLDFFNPSHHKQRILTGMSTGYQFMDNLLGGGWSPKTLHVVMGPPKSGKTWWLVNLYANAVQSGHNSAYISLEVEDKKLMRRVGSNLLSIPYSKYVELSQNESYIKESIQDFCNTNLKVGTAVVKEYPASSATVPEIEAYLRKIEENRGKKFFTVFIDYINIVSNYRNANSENTYMKIKQLSEDLRAMAQRNEWCIITATQTNRGAMDASDISVTDTAESAGLLHTVDSMWAIIQDQLMAEQSEYYLKALLLRDENGKGNKQKFEVDRNYGRIVQAKDLAIDGNNFF